MMFFYLAGCLVLFACTGYMILAPCYEDGILGKCFLGLLFIGTGAALAKAWEMRLPCPPAEVVLAIDGAALFLLRHLYRFRRFCATRKDAL